MFKDSLVLHVYIQYHILGRHVILMLCLNLMLGPTYLPYFFLAANRNHTYISFRPYIISQNKKQQQNA